MPPPRGRAGRLPEAAQRPSATPEGDRRAARRLVRPTGREDRGGARGGRGGRDVHPGQPSEEGAERVTNTLLISDGEQLKVSYDKIHLYDAFGFQESQTVQPGAEPVTVKVSGATVGFATCYDVRFPTSSSITRAAVHQRPSCPPHGSPARAKSRSGRRSSPPGPWTRRSSSSPAGRRCPKGQTWRSAWPRRPVWALLVVSPTGSVIAEAYEGPELLIVDIDPADVQEARKRIPVLQNARDLS